MNRVRSEVPTTAWLQEALRQVEPDAVLVSARLLRRLIRRRHPQATTGLHVPHRKSLVVRASEALKVATPEALGLVGPDGGGPDADRMLILLRKPDRGFANREELLLGYWRLLFHARVHESLERAVADGRLNWGIVRERTHQIGEVAFDEARSVLRREHRLIPPVDDVSTYIEFAAHFLELRYFAPELLPLTFPAIDDLERIDPLLARDVDAPALFAATRPAGAAEPAPQPVSGISDLDLDIAEEPLGPEPLDEPALNRFSDRLYRGLLMQADRAERLGNHVRAAILRTRAARVTTPARAGQARSAGRDALDALARRLQPALECDDAERARWTVALRSLQDRAARGPWPAEARLLSDLQAVCLDHEREFYRIDLVEWAFSFGRRSLKRLLPNQREVAECKHLRRANRRLGRVRLADEDRERLARLLHRAVDRAENRLRERFRPLIRRALERADFEPKNLPERVAFDKVVEELLDQLVDRGYLSAGDLRDALSRNQLKLPDLRPSTFLRGDRLLRADHRLGISLEGVYRRAEIYIRALQKGSSVAFGSPIGRLLTLFLVLPFGGAFVVLEGLQHLVEPVLNLFGGHGPPSGPTFRDDALAVATLGAGRIHGLAAPGHAAGAHLHFVNTYSVLTLGLFLLALIHLEGFRRLTVRALRGLGRALRVLLIDLPVWVTKQPILRALVFSKPAVLLWHWVLAPLALTIVLGLLLREDENDSESFLIAGAATYLIATVVLNSRLGRDIEEELIDQFQLGWTRITTDFLPSVYRAVMDFFDRALEALDRLLYSVDEWFRFRTGQSRLTLGIKAVLGLAWSFVTYVIRFCINLLVEPQINPIKHFPVVTVAHKIMLPFMLALPPILMGSPLGLSAVRANSIAFALQMLLPGVFGFLVWELKENWRLYDANRAKTLRPVIVGHHGETLVRLLRPGLHSGTLPKTFARLRQATRQARLTGRARALHRQRESLRHLEHAVAHFLDREFLAMLRQGGAFRDADVSLADVELATNRIRARFHREGPPGDPWVVSFEEQSGWLAAGTVATGWLDDLPVDDRQALALALAGLYKKAGVDLVREQIRLALDPPTTEYDIVPAGLHAWLPGRPEAAHTFDLRDLPRASPEPDATGPPTLDASRLLFGRAPITWQHWVVAWQREETGQSLPGDPATGPVLPPAMKTEVSRSR